jgi:hypothetical protein
MRGLSGRDGPDRALERTAPSDRAGSSTWHPDQRHDASPDETGTWRHPSVRSREPPEISHSRICLGWKARKAAALVDEVIPIARVVNVQQRRHHRPQAAFGLGIPMACDPLARGCIGDHRLRVTPTATQANPGACLEAGCRLQERRPAQARPSALSEIIILGQRHAIAQCRSLLPRLLDSIVHDLGA